MVQFGQFRPCQPARVSLGKAQLAIVKQYPRSGPWQPRPGIGNLIRRFPEVRRPTWELERERRRQESTSQGEPESGAASADPNADLPPLPEPPTLPPQPSPAPEAPAAPPTTTP